MPFLDMIRNETVKVTICKSVMVEVAAKMGPVNDPVVTDALMSICQIMHDSVKSVVFKVIRFLSCFLLPCTLKSTFQTVKTNVD